MSDPLTMEQAREIAESIEYRQGFWDGESLEQSVMVVLLNTGSKFIKVRCINGEWSGTKADIPPRNDGGVPLCPNGHVMLETAGSGKRLGYVNDDG